MLNRWNFLKTGFYEGIKFDLVLQKCTELGVSAFVPVYSERTVPKKSEGSTRSRREDRWRKILAEAAEQSGRGLIPRLVQVSMVSENVRLSGQRKCHLYCSR